MLHSTVRAHQSQVNPTSRLVRRAIPVAIAAAFLMIAAISLQQTVTAHDGGRRVCSDLTLRGDYGLVTGIRGLGPGITESFVGVAVRTYDGHGRFAQVDNSHGQVTGAQTNVPATGTYVVNADCSGTSVIYFPSAPPVETAFVVVGQGEEVKDIVMAPPPNLVTAVLRRVGG